jgi:hypothetical protein
MCGTACTEADAESYAGIFKDERLTVEVKSAPEGYAGTIQMGHQTFPLKARDAGSRLEGTFEHQGASFEFTATLAADTLTLVSGGTTYKLKKQEAVDNPLVPQAGIEARKPPSAGAPPAATSGGTVRFKTFSVRDRDDMIGGEVVSFLAPSTWKVDGGVTWRVHPILPASLTSRLHDPQGPDSVEFFPTLPFSWGGLTGPGTFFPQGSIYLGNEVQPPPAGVIQCIQTIVIPRFRAKVHPRIVKEEELPDLAKVVKAENPDQGGVRPAVSAAKVRIEYQESGKTVEEDIYCALVVMPLPGGNMTIWMADKLAGLRAEKGKLDGRTKIFQTIIHSAKLNLQWFNKYAQLVQALTRAQMQQIKNAGEFSKILSKTSSEISSTMQRAYEERQAAMDRVNENFSQHIRGVDAYHDPVEGKAVELPSGYTDAWVNSRGEYVITENPNFNPNVEMEGGWRKLEKKEP